MAMTSNLDNIILISYRRNWNNWTSRWEVGVASPIKVAGFFLFICLSQGLKDSFFAVFFPPNPKAGILDVLA